MPDIATTHSASIQVRKIAWLMDSSIPIVGLSDQRLRKSLMQAFGEPSFRFIVGVEHHAQRFRLGEIFGSDPAQISCVNRHRVGNLLDE